MMSVYSQIIPSNLRSGNIACVPAVMPFVEEREPVYMALLISRSFPVVLATAKAVIPPAIVSGGTMFVDVSGWLSRWRRSIGTRSSLSRSRCSN